MKIKISSYQAQKFARLLYDFEKAQTPTLKKDNSNISELLFFNIIKEMYKKYYIRLDSAGSKGITINFKDTEALAIYYFTNKDESFYLLYEQIYQAII